MKKTDLQKEGFDPSLVKGDKLYYLDLKQSKYLPLGPEEYEKILKGIIRLWSKICTDFLKILILCGVNVYCSLENIQIVAYS